MNPAGIMRSGCKNPIPREGCDPGEAEKSSFKNTILFWEHKLF